jgi:hypothetical protein
MQLLPTATPGHDEARFLQELEMLGNPDPGHVMTVGQCDQRLTVLREQRVE